MEMLQFRRDSTFFKNFEVFYIFIIVEAIDSILI